MLILSDEFLPAFFVLFSDMVEQAFIEVRLWHNSYQIDQLFVLSYTQNIYSNNVVNIQC
jgi:hypothetical protein